jgi:hypothetical protein
VVRFFPNAFIAAFQYDVTDGINELRVVTSDPFRSLTRDWIPVRFTHVGGGGLPVLVLHEEDGSVVRTSVPDPVPSPPRPRAFTIDDAEDALAAFQRDFLFLADDDTHDELRASMAPNECAAVARLAGLPALDAGVDAEEFEALSVVPAPSRTFVPLRGTIAFADLVNTAQHSASFLVFVYDISVCTILWWP